jgi:hypothetical protein
MNTASSVDPTTTLEEDRLTAAARAINLIWEVTQALIAVAVVLANVLAAFYLPGQNALLANAFFLIIGFYFGRTNHARSGGIVSRAEK